jgi:tetratricopeptide (TPR) repeat protein
MRSLELEPDAQTLQVLVALHRRQKDWMSVASCLLRSRDLAPTPDERSRIQTEVAQVYERELADDEAAIEGYRTALEFDPANQGALASLERLYTKLDRPAELLSVYERQLELSPDYRERVTVLFKSASIWEDRYQNLAHADACIEGVLSMDPQNLQAI